MELKPQDLFVTLKLVALGDQDWTYASLAGGLGLSASQTHTAVKQALRAQLTVQHKGRIKPHRANLLEFLAHGVRYVFVPERGELTRGMPTGYAAPFLSQELITSDDPPPVWPDPEGDVRGISFSPLCKSAPQAARQDPAFYTLLVLVDLLRQGRARERRIAIRELKRRLKE